MFADVFLNIVAVDGGKTGQPQAYMDFADGSSYPGQQSTKADQSSVKDRVTRDYPGIILFFCFSYVTFVSDLRV